MELTAGESGKYGRAAFAGVSGVRGGSPQGSPTAFVQRAASLRGGASCGLFGRSPSLLVLFVIVHLSCSPARELL